MQNCQQEVVCDGNVHLMPEDDGFDHVESMHCMCSPTLGLIPNKLEMPRDIKTSMWFVHHGLDGSFFKNLPE
jgi:hypothetical protein